MTVPAAAESAKSAPTLICATPVRNEAWIIGQFLAAASVWADVIVLIDQNSTDGTLEIARKFPKVRIAANTLAEYNEGHYRRLMLAEARKVPGPRLIFALDADEFLNADLLGTPEWQSLLQLPPGGLAMGHWVNLRDSFQWCHIVDAPMHLCYRDDDRGEAQDTFIHCQRLPVHPAITPLVVDRALLLHYQYIAWDRMKAKQRWYQALELCKDPQRRAVSLYRVYHHMDISWTRRDAVQEEWFGGYESRGIDMRTVRSEPHSWYELELLRLFEQHGTRKFRRLDLWDVDWVEAAVHFGLPEPQRFRDPRSWFERAVHRWLQRTQDYYQDFFPRLITKALRLFGW